MRRSLPALILLLCVGCFKPLVVEPAEVPKLGSLEEVMRGAETSGSKLWKLEGSESYSDAEWTTLAAEGPRMVAFANHSKTSFSRGAEFDKFADELAAHGQALSDAAGSKNAAAASSAIGALKSTCKGCHSATR